MRLKKEVLKRRCKGPLSRVMYLNLSGLDLDIIERLNTCEYLHWFIARNNNFQTDEGIEKLKQLWYLDLSNNKLSCAISLNRFLALGTLILSNNNLKWPDLARLRQAHIMSLSLHGNPQLDSDPYYRIHVIDSLPLIWELDGRLVTVTERLHVKQFFVDTQYTEHPIRHKVSKPFQTTTLKNIGTEGIVSDKCKYIFSKFPVSETHTKHTDERRLSYITRMVQEDMQRFLFEQDIRTKLEGNFLEDLLAEREKDVERCNMILLLLVISLEFQLPTALVRSALVASQLDMIGAMSIMPFFLLPREYRTRVIGLLLNAAKVDRDNKVSNEGGLYAQLFMCIYYTVAQLTRISQTSHNNMQKIKPIPHNSDYMALMASEVVSLMLRGTQFLHLIPTEHGVVSLLAAATGGLDSVHKVKEKMHALEEDLTGKSDFEKDEEIRAIVFEAIEQRLSTVNIKMADIPIGDRYLALSDSLPIKPLHSVIWASNFLSSGKIIPQTSPPILRPAKKSARQRPLQPKLGEKVLLGPQAIGELAMLMEGEIAMVKIDAVPVANGAVVSRLKSADAHFAFVDMKNMCYAHNINMWRPLKTEGDRTIEEEEEEERYTIHSTLDKPPCLFEEHAVAIVKTENDPLMYTSNEATFFKSRQKQANRNRESSFQLSGIKEVFNDNKRPVQSAVNFNHNENTNFSFSTKEFEELFPEDNSFTPRPASVPSIAVRAPSAGTNKRKVACSVVNCGSLHENDNVHYIRGFTPREDSSRSCSVTVTPSDRKQLSAKSQSATIASEKSMTFLKEVEEKVTQLNDEQSSGNETSRLNGMEENGHSNKMLDKEVTGTPSPNVEISDNKLPEEVADPSSSRLSPKEPETHCHNEAANDDAFAETEVDDNCPICIAKRQGTILKSVNGQLESVNMEMLSETEEQISILNKENVDMKNESSVNPENLPNKNEEKDFKQAFQSRIRPISSLPTGGIRLRSGDAQQGSRPLSAMESYSYYVITNPPNVVAKGTKARINDRYGQGFYKTDFQQEREEAWKRTTISRRPQTAAVMTSSHMPPPQRPSSPIIKGGGNAFRPSKFKVTRTDRWLGGGKDLYWDSMRKRPKSGHVPGWKEGLPESMRKKQRPFTAHSMPGSRTSISRPGSTAFFASCSSCSPTPYGHVTNVNTAFMRGEEDSGLMMMPQSQAIPHPMDIRTRVVTSPVSDEEEQIYLDDNLAKETNLFIQGLPPFTVPHPRKFTYLPFDMDAYSDYNLTLYSHTQGDNQHYHSTTREELKCNMPSQFDGESCPPPSPREEGNFCFWENDEMGQGQITDIKISCDNVQKSERYRVCPFHEKLFKKKEGNVIIYVIESDPHKHLEF